jgi:hypoxanthine phosphoribosyltransferase
MPPERVLLSQAKIRARVRQLASEITRHYQKQPKTALPPVFLGVMNGALFFHADLVREVELDVEIACVGLASYAGTSSTGIVRGLDALGATFRGRRVLIIDDILDTGRTLSTLTAHLRQLGAVEVKICVLLEKRRKREAPIKADWIGFKIADEFVVGYGLDHDGHYRGLKQVRILKTLADTK